MAESALSYVAPTPVAAQSDEVRTAFLRRVYAHLGGAIAAFILLEFALFSTGLALDITLLVARTNWLLILGGFVLISWLSSTVAHRAETPAAQYSAYAALIVAEALIFAPLLYIAAERAPAGTISQAAMLTLVGFAGLTLIALSSGRDFSALGGMLKWIGVVALLAIVGAVLFGFELGTWFSVAMVAFAGALILYSTSKVLRSYPADRHVAASMELFASVALMFWYVLSILSRD